MKTIREQQLEKALQLCANFIENVSALDPERTSKFFQVREAWREALGTETPDACIRMMIEISVPGGKDGAVAIAVDTGLMDRSTVTDQQGALWVAVCQALNQLLQRRGFQNFDCLRQRGMH